MNTSNPNMIVSMQARRTTGHRVPVPQFQGVHDATIFDSDRTNSTVNPSGQCRVIIPSFNETTPMGPIPYSGAYCPPNGTGCIVGYVHPTVASNSTVNSLRVIAYTEWSGKITVTGSVDAPSGGGEVTALASLLEALATLGIIVNDTTG